MSERVAAGLIDALVLLVPLALVVLFVDWAAPDSDDAAAWAGLALIITVLWLYCAVLQSSAWQATIGQRALGLRVTDAAGGRLTFAGASGRFFAPLTGPAIWLLRRTRGRDGAREMAAGTCVASVSGDAAAPPVCGLLSVIITGGILVGFVWGMRCRGWGSCGTGWSLVLPVLLLGPPFVLFGIGFGVAGWKRVERWRFLSVLGILLAASPLLFLALAWIITLVEAAS